MITYPAVSCIVETWISAYTMKYYMMTSGEVLRPANYYYQQDGDPEHWASICREWFEDHSINLLLWVPSSADMNIIENVWSQLKHQIHAQPILLQTKTQLWEALQEE